MPPSPLELIRALAGKVRRVNPMEFSKNDVAEWRDFSRKVFRPEQQRAWDRQQQWAERAQNTWNEAQMEKYLQAASDAEYTADRYGKLDQAAAQVVRAKPYDNELRASFLPGEGAPSGIITYQLPGYYRGDPVADAATYVELLGTAPNAQGAGRVLLRDAGMTAPSNPLVLHSVSDPRTTGFYEARGMNPVLPENQQGSLLKSDIPLYKILRGDLLKEKKGGLVQYKECTCGK